MSKDNNIGKINRITDSIIDNIINTDEKVILEEVKQEYSDPLYKAKKMRNIIKRAKVKIGKENFQKVKDELKAFKESNNTEASKTSRYDNPLDDLDITMAARDGNKITDNDMKTIKDDLDKIDRMKRND